MTRRLPATPTPPRRRSSKAQWDAAARGELPAEALSTRDREQLVHELWKIGWVDDEISQHTAETNYTVARIRQRLELAPNEASTVNTETNT